MSAATLHAQDLGTPRKLWWLNIGAGFSSGVEPGLPGIGLGLSYKHNPGLFSLRTAYFEEFQICLFGGCGNPDRAWDAGALYGVITKSRTTFASASAGIGLAGGRRGGEKSFTTVGIPLETQLFVTPFRHANVGFGLYGLGDINPKKSFWGALFCLQVGRLK
ncbi:MAG TPA: hypothetical protein VNL73_04645 [Verrucomicrobiae bacterium]|nr:hypothetical protein [Verrucomicrobiae bacterium]